MKQSALMEINTEGFISINVWLQSDTITLHHNKFGPVKNRHHKNRHHKNRHHKNRHHKNIDIIKLSSALPKFNTW